jgi:hypothetical protein
MRFTEEVRPTRVRKQLKCSFCGKSEQEVKKLVAGPRVYICDECVAMAVHIMQCEPIGEMPASKDSGSLTEKLRDLWRWYLTHMLSRLSLRFSSTAI